MNRNDSMVFIWGFILIVLVSSCGKSDRHEADTAIGLKFGTLPVIQALPLFYAREKSLFEQAGLPVELITFNSALAQTAALEAGSIDGFFSDLVTPILLAGTGTDIQLTSRLFDSTPEQRMFAVLGAPAGEAHTVPDLVAAGLAGSSNTVIEYFVSRLLDGEVVAVPFVETKNIPVRLQLLLDNQVAGAVLPEPLASLAELRGARRIADDSDREHTTTALAFRGDALKDKSDLVRKFLAVVATASRQMLTDTTTSREVMNKYCRVPTELSDHLRIPTFPPLAVPHPTEVHDVIQWLNNKGMLTRKLTPDRVIAHGFNP